MSKGLVRTRCSIISISFKETENRVEMTDIVDYALPFDPFSRPINALIVEKTVKEIFKFREKKFEELFPVVIASGAK